MHSLIGKKGVAEIIGEILILIIAIGLAGTAYVYISGIMSAKTVKTISVLEASCNTNGNITLIISNSGSGKIDNSGATKDLKIFVDNRDETSKFEKDGLSGNTDYTIDPREIIVIISNVNYATGATHRIMVISPSNSISETIFC